MGKASRKKKAKRAEPKSKAMELISGDDPLLRSVALFEAPGEQWVRLGQRLVNTAIKNNGYAVAAPQVGVNVRLVGLCDGTVVLNPSVQPQPGSEKEFGTEGCLSFPERWWNVARDTKVLVLGLHPGTGMPVALEAEGIEARVWQHEIDHLDGLLLDDGRWPEFPQ